MPNPSSAKKANPFAVQRAKLKATYRTARFLLKMFGAITLLLALVMTWVLSSLFHLNIPMAFLGSIVACIVLGMVVLPVKVVWRSKLSQICQVEGPWELADELTFSEIGTALDDILSGRRPREEKPNLALALTNVKLLFIRKGEPQKALKIAEYLVENSEPGTSNYIYQKNTLACLNVEMGMYQHGMALLRANLAQLESEERAGSPAYNSVMLGMLEAYIQQRRVDEAEMWLAKLKESIDTMHGNTCKNHTDELVKFDVGSFEKDMAFYWKGLGRIKAIRDDVSAEDAFKQALELMSKECNRKHLTLLYPEIMLKFADFKIQRKKYREAESLIKDAIAYFDQKTRYRGPAYLSGQCAHAYVKFKTGAAPEQCLQDMEAAVTALKSHYQEGHPLIATALAQLGECYIAAGKYDAARDALARALSARKTLFPQNDATILEVENLLASVPENASLSA